MLASPPIIELHRRWRDPVKLLRADVESVAQLSPANGLRTSAPGELKSMGERS